MCISGLLVVLHCDLCTHHPILLLFFPLYRLGRNGVEEIQAHPWLRNLNFDTLRQQPAPYRPRDSGRIKTLLDELRAHEPSAPVNRTIVQQITSNFDDFSEEESWGCSQVSVPFGCLASSPPDRQEFIGYTFKRKKDVPIRSSITSVFDKQE